MHVSRTPAEMLLTNRLDPDYYAPQHLADQRLLEEIGSIYLGTIGRLFVGPFGSELPTSVFSDTGVPLFRVGNVGQMEVDERNLAKIPLSLHTRLSASEVLLGDLLIVKASVGEKICVVPRSIGRANITQHIIGIRPNGNIDIHYVAAALYGMYGRRQLQRRSLGAIIQYLGVTDARSVFIPKIEPDAQRYIGNKLRQADALRQEAQHLLIEIKEFFKPLHKNPKQSWRGNWYRTPTEIGEQRLDAWYYAPEPTELNMKLVSSGSHPLGELVQLIKENSFDRRQPFQYFEIGGLDVSTGYTWPSCVAVGEAPSRAQRSVKVWDILVSTVRPERKNVGLIHDCFNGQLVASSGFAVLRAKTYGLAGFIWGFLRSDAATVQLLRWNTGAAYPAIDDTVPLDILIPEYSQVRMENLGNRWRQAPVLLHLAKNLTVSARFLVEALIERKVSERDLIAAHHDKTKDREILSRLTAKGIDVSNEPPLLPDLDALFDLLETSTPTETE